MQRGWMSRVRGGGGGCCFDLSVAQIMQAKQICCSGRASTFILPDQHVNVSGFFHDLNDPRAVTPILKCLQLHFYIFLYHQTINIVSTE